MAKTAFSIPNYYKEYKPPSAREGKRASEAWAVGSTTVRGKFAANGGELTVKSHSFVALAHFLSLNKPRTFFSIFPHFQFLYSLSYLLASFFVFFHLSPIFFHLPFFFLFFFFPFLL